jgi:hypothetical protein
MQDEPPEVYSGEGFQSDFYSILFYNDFMWLVTPAFGLNNSMIACGS